MRSPLRHRWIAVVLGMLAFPASSRITPMPFQPESRLWLEGTSTVRAFTCQAGAITGAIAINPAAPRLSVAQLNDSFRDVHVTIPVAALDCRNGTMNDHMRRALKAEDHPTIEFDLSGFETVREGSTEAVARLTGGLTMAGETRPITLEATATAATDGSIRVVGSHSLLMTEWGVRPPSLMLGAMKVRDPVTIRFDVVLKP